MNAFLTILAGCFALLTNPFGLPREWSLEACIRHALENNPQMRMQELEIRQRQTERRLAPLEGLPRLELRLGNEYNWGRSVDMQELQIIEDRLSSAGSITLAASLSVTDAALALFGRRRKGVEAELSLLEKERLGEDLTVRVTRAYLQLLLAEQIYRKSCISYEEMVRRQERTETEVRAGVLPESARWEIEAQVHAEKAAMIRAQGECTVGYVRLGNLLDLPPGMPLRILPPPDDTLPPPRHLLPAEMYRTQLAGRPRMQLLLGQSRREALRLREWRLSRIPKLSVAAGFGTFRTNSVPVPLKEQLRSNRNPSFSITLSVPLLEGVRRRSESAAVQSEIERLKLAREEEQGRLYGEWQEAAVEVTNCYERYLAARSALKAFEEV